MNRHKYSLAIITACLLAVLIVPLARDRRPMQITPAQDTTAYRNDVLLGDLLQSSKNAIEERKQARMEALKNNPNVELQAPIKIDRTAVRLFLSARRNFEHNLVVKAVQPSTPILKSTAAVQQQKARLDARKQQQEEAKRAVHSAPTPEVAPTNFVASNTDDKFALTEQGQIIIDKLGFKSTWLKPSDDLYGDWENLEISQQNGMNLGVTDYSGPLSTKPGELGNKFIIGHSSAPNRTAAASGRGDAFADVAKLEVGDLMTVRQNGKEYIYQIYESVVVDPSDTEILTPQNNEDRLTLITCWPIGTTELRTLRNARLISEQTYTVDAS